MGGQNVTILNNNTFLKINDEIRKKVTQRHKHQTKFI